MSKLTRPPLKYMGGKFKLADWIMSFFPVHRKYVEPYGGGASILMKKRTDRKTINVYNDLNNEIVNLFKVLRDPVKAKRLADLVYNTPFSRQEYVEAFIVSEDDVESALKVLIRSHMSYGGSAIFGKSCGFKGNPRANLPEIYQWSEFHEHFPLWTKILKNVIIENKPALDLIDYHDYDDCLFYCDPPYVHSTRSSVNRNKYTYEMTDDEHRELAVKLNSLTGMVILSGYPSEFYAELYPDWEYFDQEAYATSNKKTIERIYLNKAAMKGQKQLNLGF